MNAAYTYNCKYPFRYNDICCKAPKTFEDKYCAEQKLWRQINCCPKPPLNCCKKKSTFNDCTTPSCDRPNYDCMRENIFRENNKTMSGLTHCMGKTCITRNCTGPYYSMKGPVYHPPNMKCQDYSLYIPTKRILQHCKCKGNHSCLRTTPKFKPNPFCQCCPQCPDPCPCDCGCNDCAGNNLNQSLGVPSGGEPCNSQQICSDNKEPCSEKGECTQNQVPAAAVQANCTENKLQNGGIFPLQQPQFGNQNSMLVNGNNTANHSVGCDCSSCTKTENNGNGNHYPDCKCLLCHQRRNGNYICPKITDRKGERCKKLWFGKNEPDQKSPSSSTLANLLSNMPENEPVECTGKDDCPCPKCCRQRAYSRIKPHHWFANGLDNPEMKYKKPPAPSEIGSNNDTNNNITGDRSPPSVSCSDGQQSPQTSSLSDDNNNKYPPQQQQERRLSLIDKEDSSNLSIPREEETLPNCKPENPCRKSFGLGVTFGDNYNKKINCCNYYFTPDDYQCWDPCAFQNNCPPKPVKPKPLIPKALPIQSSSINKSRQKDRLGTHVSEQALNELNDYNTTTYRHFFKRCKPQPLRNSKRSLMTNPNQFLKNNKRNDLELDQNYDAEECPADDNGWCSGKPRYRRGRKFNEDCQAYPLDVGTFRIFADLDKRLALCQKCERQECPTRTCNDRNCLMPLTMDIHDMY